MNKPVIVIDLDNVLAESAVGLIAFSNSHFDTSITLEDYSEDWQTMWGVSHEEAERRGVIMRQHQIQRDYSPVAGAKEVLEELKEHFELVILTSRRRESEIYTKEWLRLHYPDIFETVVFSGFFEAENVVGSHLLTKGEQYKELNASYVIDDHFKHCKSATQANAHAVLFGDYPWNQAGALPKQIIHCANWVEVQTYLSYESSL